MVEEPCRTRAFVWSHRRKSSHRDPLVPPHYCHLESSSVESMALRRSEECLGNAATCAAQGFGPQLNVPLVCDHREIPSCSPARRRGGLRERAPLRQLNNGLALLSPSPTDNSRGE